MIGLNFTPEVYQGVDWKGDRKMFYCPWHWNLTVGGQELSCAGSELWPISLEALATR